MELHAACLKNENIEQDKHLLFAFELLPTLISNTNTIDKNEMESNTNTTLLAPFSPEIDCNIVLNDVTNSKFLYPPLTDYSLISEECSKSEPSLSVFRPIEDIKPTKSATIINIGMVLAQSFRPDILGINRMDNNVYKDTELCDDPNWWISPEYYYNNNNDTNKSGIEFNYDPSFVDYGVII